jgi:murein DD-endopeptidase MepM/ murein hydrolase activator NlpD
VIKISATARPDDNYGSGKFGAPRGVDNDTGEPKFHNGIDYAPQVHALSAGEVTKLGYPYENDLSYRYVQITDEEGLRVRYFYISPAVKVGDMIHTGAVLGILQDLGKRYPNITPHYHLEIKDKQDNYINPEEYIRGL